MTYDIDLYRAVVLARLPEDGLFRTYIKRVSGGEPRGLSPEGSGDARAVLKWLMLDTYAAHGDPTQPTGIARCIDTADENLPHLSDTVMSVLEDDLGYIATDTARCRCYFNLSVLRENQVATDPNLRAAYYQIATPERVAAVCRVRAGPPLHALFALGGRPDIETMADITCLDVARVVSSMRLYGRAGYIRRCAETGVFEINYDLLRLVDMETQ